MLNLKRKKKSVSSFYGENNFKPCLTKQLLNMFKLWCERGISDTQNDTVIKAKVVSGSRAKPITTVPIWGGVGWDEIAKQSQAELAGI